MARKDNRGRNLKEGESYRSDGRYMYRYTDARTGKRKTVYSQNLAELREKEKQILKDMAENIETDAGVRTIPMSDDVCKAFEAQKKLNFLRGIHQDVEIEGRSGFIFTAKSGRPLMPSGLNNVLYNIVKAYNKQEQELAKQEKRKEELMPRISAHSLRHTGCTRMAEQGLDMKVVQYVMGHANVGVTMEVYNHITEKARIEKEIAKMNTVKVG